MVTLIPFTALRNMRGTVDVRLGKLVYTQVLKGVRELEEKYSCKGNKT